MAEPRYRYLKSTIQQGILVLTPTDRRLEGDETAHAMLLEIKSAVAHAGVNKLIINLEHVDYLTSAIFRPFLAIRKQLLAENGRLIFCNLSSVVHDTFNITQMIPSGYFQAEPDLDAALKCMCLDPAPAPENPAASVGIRENRSAIDR